MGRSKTLLILNCILLSISNGIWLSSWFETAVWSIILIPIVFLHISQICLNSSSIEVKLTSLTPSPEHERETGEQRRSRDILIAIDHGPNIKHAFDWARSPRPSRRYRSSRPCQYV